MEVNPNEIPELRKEFQQKKKEIGRSRFKLNSLNAEKENAFRELRSVSDKVKTRLSRIKQLKQERDELTKQVKSLKEERGKLNLEVKEKASQHKQMEEKKKELLGDFNVSDNPSKIKAEIAHLEEKIETEVMPFSKEQQLTKRIKELKIRYKEVAKLDEVWKEVNTVSADFAEQRRKAQESHWGVQEKANESQKKHEQIQVLFDEVKNLRETEQPLAEKHLQLKVEYEQIKKTLEDLLKRVNELAKILDEQQEMSFKEKVKERTAEVREKIKTRKKLSTEDILAFQAIND